MIKISSGLVSMTVRSLVCRLSKNVCDSPILLVSLLLIAVCRPLRAYRVTVGGMGPNTLGESSR